MIEVSAKDIGKVLATDDKTRRRAMHVGLRRAAHIGRGILVQQATNRGKIDRGQYRAAFRIVREHGARALDRRQGATYTILNDAPYAGVIELGARPHKVSEAGREAIREWVRRKVLGFSASEADENAIVDEITMGIVKKLEIKGQQGTFIVRDSLPILRDVAAIEIRRAISERMP